MIEFDDAWILKAEGDLKPAEIALRQNDPLITDVAIFHTQQCAEKAFKGFLAFKQAEIRKIHHLVPLVEQCTTFDPDFETLILDASDLTPLGTEFRYPDDIDEIENISQLFSYRRRSRRGNRKGKTHTGFREGENCVIIPQTLLHTTTLMIESDWINRTEQIRLRLTQLRDSL